MKALLAIIVGFIWGQVIVAGMDAANATEVAKYVAQPTIFYNLYAAIIGPVLCLLAIYSPNIFGAMIKK